MIKGNSGEADIVVEGQSSVQVNNTTRTTEQQTRDNTSVTDRVKIEDFYPNTSAGKTWVKQIPWDLLSQWVTLSLGTCPELTLHIVLRDSEVLRMLNII